MKRDSVINRQNSQITVSAFSSHETIRVKDDDEKTQDLLPRRSSQIYTRNSPNRRGSTASTVNKRKFLYEGSKTFWKLRCTLDIFIQLHQNSGCIELMGYNATTGQESNHIFLDLERIKIKRSTSATTIPGLNASSNEDPVHQFVIHYVLSRLNVVRSNEDELIICLNALFTDAVHENTNDLDTILANPPPNVVPITIQRQKTTPMEEMKKQMNEFYQENSEITKDLAYIDFYVQKDLTGMTKTTIPSFRKDRKAKNYGLPSQHRHAIQRRALVALDAVNSPSPHSFLNTRSSSGSIEEIPLTNTSSSGKPNYNNGNNGGNPHVNNKEVFNALMEARKLFFHMEEAEAAEEKLEAESARLQKQLGRSQSVRSLHRLGDLAESSITTSCSLLQSVHLDRNPTEFSLSLFEMYKRPPPMVLKPMDDLMEGMTKQFSSILDKTKKPSRRHKESDSFPSISRSQPSSPRRNQRR